jgi:hypothetical protein
VGLLKLILGGAYSRCPDRFVVLVELNADAVIVPWSSIKATACAPLPLPSTGVIMTWVFGS